jgi:hypothetical protein
MLLDLAKKMEPYNLRLVSRKERMTARNQKLEWKKREEQRISGSRSTTFEVTSAYGFATMIGHKLPS